MEKLLHYAWRHGMLPPRPLSTTDGLVVEVIDAGLRNDDAGPDFFNAKVKIGGTLWVGNVEIHDKAADWYAHGHDKDGRYDNVVLHVVGREGADTLTSSGRRVPQLRLEVPPSVAEGYQDLLRSDRYPPCHDFVSRLDRVTIHGWLSRLQAERLERKTEDMERRVARCGGSWEWALLVTMARAYGFGVNGDAFEEWALGIPPTAAARHRDDLLQIEALFLGRAGLLEPSATPCRHGGEPVSDDYLERLRAEYSFLAGKFGLRTMSPDRWRYLRMRPQNFPHVRLSQLASLYHSRRCDLSGLAECADADAACAMLAAETTPYWRSRYAFGQPGAERRKSLSTASLDLMIINVVVPVLFAYGTHRRDEALRERALNLLGQLRPENNRLTRLWEDCGLRAESAADSQALVQLSSAYCDKKDCLRCRVGYEYLKRRGGEGSP